MQEIWKDIQGFENLYKVSTDGRIKARTGKIIKPYNNGFGYLTVHLYKDGESHSRKIHRLVAEAFISNPERKPQVNHIDGDKSNNHVDNLEWATQSENMQHAYSNGLRQKLKQRVAQIEITTKKPINVYKSTSEAEKATGIRHEYISCACRYKKTAGGFIWEYKESLKAGI